MDWIEESVHRHRLVIRSDTLMDTHYHLIVETPLANLSAAMQWLGVSYSTWFNRRYRRVGHLFQGRFKGILLEPSRALALSRYLHLNPVAIRRFGMDKTFRKRGRAGLGQVPEADWVRRRLEYLRGYRWSSYAAYVGMEYSMMFYHGEEVKMFPMRMQQSQFLCVDCLRIACNSKIVNQGLPAFQSQYRIRSIS